MRYICPLVLFAGLIAFTSLGCGGMSTSSHYMTQVQKENGLIVILPGIEGEGEFNHNIRRGLARAGSHRAMPIYNWGRPIPGIGLILNQVDIIGNRLAGGDIARMIEKYQDNYPNRPVYIVGHSGGGGVAVFAAESLAEGRQIEGIVLLAASIDGSYDLTKALKHCKNGVLNYYNPSDTGLLGVGTAVMGNVDGGRGPSAGLNGFKKKRNRLYQVQVTGGMTASSGGGTHDAPTRPGFVSSYVAPWILSSIWPPDASLANQNSWSYK